jgi:hypothetical protein
MRHVLLATGFALAVSAVIAADRADTPAAAHSRSKRLRGKITLEAKDDSLRAVLAALSEQVEDQKLGKLGFTFAPGVSPSEKVSISVKDKPLAAALDELLKTADLGYVVVSKAGDKSDGWLRITKGKERGYEAGAEPKEPAVDDTDEQAAAEKLEAAKKYLADDKPADAKVMIRYVLKKYPSTKAAAEAKELAEKIGK